MRQTLFFSLTVSILLFSCKKDKTTAASNADVVFVYKSEIADGQAYKTMIETKGKTVALVAWSDVNAYDYSNTKLVVIGNEFGNFNWSDTLHASAAKLRSLNKPCLYIGAMGAFMAYYNNKKVNYQTSAFWNLQDLTVTNTTSNVFTTPNTIAIPANNTIQIATGAVANKYIAYWAPALPSDVNSYSHLATQAAYHFCTVQNGTVGFWGWLGSMADLTDTGKNMLVNLSFFLMA